MIPILFTGGTISMRPDPVTGVAVPAMNGRDLLEQVPALHATWDIEAEDVLRIPGWHMTPECMWQLARRTAAWLERPDVDGLVVTHGTDTIEETAVLLDLLVTSPKPIVIVGAMRTVADPGWDGAANLIAGLRVAAAPASGRRGTLVVLGEHIHAGLEAVKTHTSALDAFRSPGLGPIGVVDAGDVRYLRPPAARPEWRDPTAEPGLRVARIETAVDLVAASAGSDDRFIRASVEAGARGLVVQTLGRGHVPPAMRPGLAAALDDGVPVVVASRCGAGAVAPVYGGEGGGRDLCDLGVIPAGRLPGAKARMMLMAALGLTRNPARLREIFAACG